MAQTPRDEFCKSDTCKEETVRLTQGMPLILPDGLGDVDRKVSRQDWRGVMILHRGASLNQPYLNKTMNQTLSYTL